MEAYERRIELTDVLIQELVWHALNPDALFKLRTFSDTLERHLQAEPLPAGARLSGVSVVIDGGQVYAELTYAAGPAD